MKQRSIWLATVGLGQQFGGIAHVARCSVDALRSGDSPDRLEHIVSLLDSYDSDAACYRATDFTIKRCRGHRLRFTAGILAQVTSRPAAMLFDHVDIAQCQTFLPNSLRSPYAVWIHGIEVWRQLPKRKLNALRGADLLIFNSKFTKRRFETFHGNQFPARVVHLTGGRLEDNAQAAAPPRKPWILTAGRIEPDRPKGHQQILDALPHIAQVVPDVQWHIVGKGGALESLRELVSKSRVAKRIHLHGFLEADHLHKLYRDCRVFAMPGCGEGFGIVYLQAMERGCVPVGSTLDAAPEVIGNGGICLDPNDGDSVQRELIGLLTESEQEFRKRSERALTRAKIFSREKFRANLIAALELVGGTGKNG